jgi:hypothetical protein
VGVKFVSVVNNTLVSGNIQTERPNFAWHSVYIVADGNFIRLTNLRTSNYHLCCPRRSDKQKQHYTKKNNLFHNTTFLSFLLIAELHTLHYLGFFLGFFPS